MTGQLPGVDLQAGGTLDPEQHLYVERKEDALLLDLLARGEYCNILSSRQVGKSSLMMRTRLALAARGVKVVLVDLAGTLGTPETADDWYVGLLGEIVRQLDLDLDVDQWWNAARGATPNQRFLAFFRDVLLPAVPDGVVIFLDEIDHTLKLPYTDDFFTAIRSMYNERPREPLFKRVTFCLAGVATPNELIKDRRTTAYNVAKTIELTDFDWARHDLRPLARAVADDAAAGERIVRETLAWTGGHPYLTARVLEEVRSRGVGAEDITAIIDQSYRDLEHVGSDVHFQAISRFLAERLSDGPATLALYQRILAGKREPDSPTIYHAQLKLSGLVRRGADGMLTVRNRIYAQIFDRAWVERSLPRQTTARYRRVAQAAGAALAVLTLAFMVYQFVIVPPRTAAARAVAELQVTSNEEVALTSHRAAWTSAPFGLGWLTAGYRAEADRALAAFWERRAAVLDARALTRLKEGRVEEACILAAAAAVKRGGALHPEVQQTFEQRGFARLRTTVGLLVPVELRFSPDAKWLLSSDIRSPKWALTLHDATSGQRSWQAEFDDLTLWLRDGRHAVESINDRIVRIVQRLEGDGQVREVGRAELSAALRGDQVFDLVNSDSMFEALANETGPRWLEAAVRSIEQCFGSQLKRDGFDIAVSHTGRHAIGSSEGVARVCSLESGALVGNSLGVRGRVLSGWRVSADARFAVAEQTNLYQSMARVYDVTSGAAVATITPAEPPPLPSGRLVRDGRWYLLGSDVVALDEGFRLVARLNGAAFTISPTQPVALLRMIPRPRVARPHQRISVQSFDGKVLAEIETDEPRTATFSPSGELLAIPTLQGTQIWSVTSPPAVPPPATAPRRESPSRTPAPPAPPPPPTPTERWGRWQTKFGMTLDENDDTIPLWPAGPRPIPGAAPAASPPPSR